MQKRTVVKGVSHFVPPRVVTNHDLSKVMDTSDEWIVERSGIRERRFASDEMTTAGIGGLAAMRVLESTQTRVEDVDFIIGCTLSPDLYFPGIAAIIQNKLGFKNVPALDIRAQCSGFIYGLATADAFLKSGQAKTLLLVCSEIQSRLLDLTTRGRDVAVLFGDGAGAVILKAEDGEAPSVKNKVRGVIDSSMGCDGSGAEILCIKSPGTLSSHFLNQADIEAGLHYPKMEGRAVFKNAVTRMCDAVTAMLDKHGLKATDIDLLVPHQANLRINEFVREKIGLPAERVFNNIHKYGNTTAATIPLCLSEAVEEKRLKQGDLVLTVAFGAGFTWGCNLVRW